MAKGSRKSAGAGEAGVLGSLPATRPARLSRRRDGAEDEGAGKRTPKSAAPAKRTTKSAAPAKRTTKSAAPAKRTTKSAAAAKRTTKSAGPSKRTTTTSAGGAKRAPSRKKTPAAAATASRGEPKAAAPEKTAPRARPAARPAAAGSGERPAARMAEQVRERGGPRPVRSGSPGLDAVPVEERPTTQPPSGAELVTTVVRAAGEVAQIGFTVGGQILRRAVDRLPRP